MENRVTTEPKQATKLARAPVDPERWQRLWEHPQSAALGLMFLGADGEVEPELFYLDVPGLVEQIPRPEQVALIWETGTKATRGANVGAVGRAENHQASLHCLARSNVTAGRNHRNPRGVRGDVACKQCQRSRG